ncbi:hypothetical protein HA44_00670 [Mixta gaviniae]|nr:hypothetical protein HA44_00670 [Mixta gaviniae]
MIIFFSDVLKNHIQGLINIGSKKPNGKVEKILAGSGDVQTVKIRILSDVTMPQPCITVVVIKMLSPDITHWLSRQLAIRCALRKLMLRNVFLNRKPLLLVELPTMINPKQHTDCCTSTFMQIVVHQAVRKLMRLCILLLRYAIQNRFTTIILFVICPLGTPCLAPEVVILVMHVALYGRQQETLKQLIQRCRQSMQVLLSLHTLFISQRHNFITG